MQDWKTTLTGFVAGAALLLAHFGLNLSTEVQTTIVAVALFVIGFFAKDAKPSGS